MQKEVNCEKCNDTAFRMYQIESDDGVMFRFELCTCVAASIYISKLVKLARQGFIFFDAA
jgi:hypothetical protein